TLWCLLYFVVVSVVFMTSAGGIAAGPCEDVVVVLCVAGGACVVVVVVVDSVVLCAITGSDRANTTSDPKATASRFLSFIRFSFGSLARLNGRVPPAAASEHNSSLPRENCGVVLARQVLSSEQKVRLLPGIFRRRANVGRPRVERLGHTRNYEHAMVFIRFDNPPTIR